MSRFLNRYLDVPRRDDEISSIADNLQVVFSARGGYGGLRESFGLGVPYDVTNAKQAVQALLEDMLANVARYEPRLKDVVFTTTGRDSDLWVSIRLTGYVGDRPCAFKIRFHQVYGEVQVDVA